MLPDSTIALDYLLDKLEWILDGLVLYPESMQANLDKTRGLIYSSRVLLALVSAGMKREDAYAIVQRNAMEVWDDIQHARSGPSYRERARGRRRVPDLCRGTRRDLRPAWASWPGGRRLRAARGSVSSRVPEVSENLSGFDHVRVVDEDGYRRIWFARKQQSSMKLDDPFETDLEYDHYLHLALPLKPDAARFLTHRTRRRFARAKRLWRDYPEAVIDAVEIDSSVVEIARELFALPDDERLNVFVDDGRAFLERSDEYYDVIFIDAFADDHVPRALLSVEFLEICRDRLTAGGVVAYNVFGALDGMHSQPFRRMYRTVGAVFAHVWIFSIGSRSAPEDVGNILMLATDADVSVEEFEDRVRGRLGGRVTVPGFESFADDRYAENVDVEGVSPMTDTPSWAVPPRPPAQ